MEQTKEQMEQLMKIKSEYEKILADNEAKKMEAVEREKFEKVKEEILKSLHGGKKVVFAHAPEKPEADVDYKAFGDFLKMVRSDDMRLKTAMSTSNAQGGYTIPVEYAKEILGALNNVASAPAKCTMVDMSAPTVNFPSWLTDMTVAWSTEASVKTTTKPTFAQKQLTLNFLYAIITMTNELAEDNIVSLAQQLKTLVGENFGLALEGQILEGNANPFTGVGNVVGTNAVACSNPIGYSDLVSVLNNTGQLERYKNNSEWWLTRGALSLIMNLVDQHGRPLWNIGNPLVEGIFPTILGKKYNISDQIADTTGTGGSTSMYFGDMKTVYLGKKSGDTNDIRVLFSETAVIDSGSAVSENAFTQNKQMYRFEMRRGILVAVPSAWVKLTTVQ